VLLLQLVAIAGVQDLLLWREGRYQYTCSRVAHAGAGGGTPAFVRAAWVDAGGANDASSVQETDAGDTPVTGSAKQRITFESHVLTFVG